MSSKTLNERTSAAPSTHIDDLAPQQELSADALNSVVGGGRSGTQTSPPIVIKGGCGDGTVDHVKKTCD